jgi:hypothetical protein
METAEQDAPQQQTWPTSLKHWKFVVVPSRPKRKMCFGCAVYVERKSRTVQLWKSLMRRHWSSFRAQRGLEVAERHSVSGRVQGQQSGRKTRLSSFWCSERYSSLDVRAGYCFHGLRQN